MRTFLEERWKDARPQLVAKPAVVLAIIVTASSKQRESLIIGARGQGAAGRQQELVHLTPPCSAAKGTAIRLAGGHDFA